MHCCLFQCIWRIWEIENNKEKKWIYWVIEDVIVFFFYWITFLLTIVEAYTAKHDQVLLFSHLKKYKIFVWFDYLKPDVYVMFHHDDLSIEFSNTFYNILALCKILTIESVVCARTSKRQRILSQLKTQFFVCRIKLHYQASKQLIFLPVIITYSYFITGLQIANSINYLWGTWDLSTAQSSFMYVTLLLFLL